MRRVDDDGIHAGTHQCLDSRLEVGTNTDCSGNTQAPDGVARRIGELLAFHDVFHGDEPTQPTLCIDERQLLDPVLLQHGSCLVERRTLRSGHEILARHELSDWPLVIVCRAEPHVAVSENADEHTVFVGDRHSGNLEAVHQFFGVVERRGRWQCHRVADHSRLRPLHFLHLCRLVFDAEVAVHHTDATAASHRNREPALGDLVHSRGHERNAQLDVARKHRASVGLVRQHVAVARHQNDVVEGQPLVPTEKLFVAAHALRIASGKPTAIGKR